MLIKSLFLKNNNYLVLIIFLIFLIRSISLFFSSLELQGDEAQYWYWGTYFDWGYYSKPPLIGWMIGLFTSLFGNTAFIIKFPSLIAHFLTATVLFKLSLLFKRNREESLFLSISYLIFFAVSLSSNIISTDPFLLLFWTLSLYFLKLSILKNSIKYVLLTSISVALGFYAKYAMIYFFPCSIFLIILTDERRQLITNISIILGLVLLLISPHVYWVYINNWLTLLHTGDNFNWGTSLFNIKQLFNFILSQFFIATPIIFFFYLKGFIKFKKFISLYPFEISYSLPILVLITIQSFISRANANWSSVAFIGIAIIACNIMYSNYKKLLYLNIILGMIILFLVSFLIVSPPNISPFNKLQGMQDAANEVKSLDDSLAVDYIIFDDRMNIAKFLYYLPNKREKIRYLTAGNQPSNHFEMLMPITIEDIKNKKIIMIHRYEQPWTSRNNYLLVKQLYKMPNYKNNFYISYFE
tara:strand:+ start:352 stop:1758 length:1407 start_codon:yes stop_codon:yes gene_type:complete